MSLVRSDVNIELSEGDQLKLALKEGLVVIRDGQITIATTGREQFPEVVLTILGPVKTIVECK